MSSASKGVLVGTSTMNNVMMPKIAGLVEEMTGLRFRNKRASAFGSHGWSGGAVDRLPRACRMPGLGMSLSLKARSATNQDALKLCREHGQRNRPSVGASTAAAEHGEYGS